MLFEGELSPESNYKPMIGLENRALQYDIIQRKAAYPVISSEFPQDYTVPARQSDRGTALSSANTGVLISDPTNNREYTSSVPSGSPHINKADYEATFYYAGVSHSPPKLIYRTSKDPFVRPTGLEAYTRLKRLYQVFDHKIADKWDKVLPNIRDILDKHQVRFSTIDLVRFRTLPDQGTPEVVSPVVVWVGVLPHSTTSEDVLNSANATLAILKDEGITDVDIEYRESVFRRSADVPLYEPASNLDAIRHVVDPLTTALGIPISGANTPHLQGTMGFYFKDGDDLYGVTARHVLFPADEGYFDYTYDVNGPRKDVLLMGTKAWDDYLKSIQMQIRRHGLAVEMYKEWIEEFEGRADDNTPAAEEVNKQLMDTRELLRNTTDAINKLQEFYEQTKKDFGKPSQRVIGHIVWSPAITVGTAPHGFTKDVCVVMLDKARFLPKFKGNVIDLGVEIEVGKFIYKMHPRKDAHPFKYPLNRLLRLNGILAEDRMHHPEMTDHDGETCLFVIKRGLATLTTIGRATGSFSLAREYFSNQTHRDSIEWAIHPYGSDLGVYAAFSKRVDSGPFSKHGDSGSMIVSGTGECCGLITGGSGTTEPSDMTYATPMFWLWPIIKAQFPNADLNPAFT